jgi:hypothetical protein
MGRSGRTAAPTLRLRELAQSSSSRPQLGTAKELVENMDPTKRLISYVLRNFWFLKNVSVISKNH